MRNLAKLVAGLLAVVLFARCGCECRRDTQKYLRMASGDELETAHFEELLGLLTNEDSLEGGEPVLMLSQLETALAQQAAGPKRDLLSRLVALADLESDTCPAELLAIVLDISALVQKSQLEPAIYEKLRDYLAYVKRFGEQKFAVCLRKLAERFELGLKQLEPGVERAFDKFLAAAFDSDSDSSDDGQLYESARDFSLAYEDFDAGRMVSVARESERLAAGQHEANSEELFFAHLRDTCARLRAPLAHLFDLFNLARTLEKPGAAPLDLSQVPIKFLKLNEYNRLCIELQSARTKADVLANVARQLEN